MSNPSVPLSLSIQDLVLINNALNEIINGPAAISLAEFQTRTGVSLNEAEALLSRISAEMGKLNAGAKNLWERERN
jgi:hypothetical protein